MKRSLLIILLVSTFSLLFAQREAPDVRKGNREYQKENYTEAEVNYHRALDKNDESFESYFNLGDALFRQEKYAEAVAQYAKAEQLLKDVDDAGRNKIDSRLAATYHNMGNAFYAQQQYDKAVGAYQQSLRHNPKDNDTRYNLVKAMQQLQQQQQQQNQQQDQQQDQQQQQQQQQQQNQQQDQQHDQQQQQDQSQDQMDKETAEQILQALEQDEQETQEKLQRQQGKKRRVEKEW